jgi:UDPglucose 6-dehydrogenase
MRDSPALAIAQTLHDRGAHVTVYDPAAGPKIPALAPDLDVAATPQEAAQGAHAVAVLTDWQEFKDLTPADLAPLVTAKTILDGRGALNPQLWQQAGWTYARLGA